MKFSILLPTRNRLELLRYAVQSVFDQDYQEWEIVVSDNASEDDVAGYVRSLGDERVKYLRSDTLLPVTENWNRTLEAGTGEYLIMLGDDDCLLNGCLSAAAGLLREYEYPDLLYTEAIQYAYPDVIPGTSEGFTQFGYCEFLNGASEPFFLSRAAAMDAVRKALGFRIVYSYNMQHSIVSRKMIHRLQEKGAFFQSPYPDYYATNALLVCAERVLVCPWPLIGIGISAKSFGFFYFNKREDEGVAFLQNVVDPVMFDRLKDKILPGSNMNTSWLLAMESLKTNFPDEVPGGVKYWRYRFMQFRDLFQSPGSRQVFLEMLERSGTTVEKIFWRLILVLDRVCSLRLFQQIWRRCRNSMLFRMHISHRNFDARRHTVKYRNLLELSRAESGATEIPESWRQRLKLKDR
jgi:glycosyltransferase involved in cell wall biosynthesis